MASATIKTRVIVISDTHSTNAFREGLPSVDVLIHCGDMTTEGLLSEFEDALDSLALFDAELKLVIAGNHDIAPDGEYYSKMGQEVHGAAYRATTPQDALRLMNGRKVLQAGVTYLHEGMHQFRLKNGAAFTVYATPYQPAFCNWAFPYVGNREDRFNPLEHVTKYAECIAVNPVPDFPSVDVMITHGPPLGHLDRMPNGAFLGCRSLQRALARARPRLHCFGHGHEGRGAERVIWSGVRPDHDTDGSVAKCVPIETTTAEGSSISSSDYDYVDVSDQSSKPLQYGRESLLVNAAMVGGHNQPAFVLWVVDLELPKG